MDLDRAGLSPEVPPAGASPVLDDVLMLIHVDDVLPPIGPGYMKCFMTLSYVMMLTFSTRCSSTFSA